MARPLSRRGAGRGPWRWTRSTPRAGGPACPAAIQAASRDDRQPRTARLRQATCRGTLVGVDTQVVHGIVDCGATGWITGIGNVLPEESLTLARLAMLAAQGDAEAGRLALELEAALLPLACLDAGPDLVAYFKHLAVARGDDAYAHSLLAEDRLSAAQANHATARLRRFEHWWPNWSGADYRA